MRISGVTGGYLAHTSLNRELSQCSSQSPETPGRKMGRSSQIILIGLRNSKDYYKRPGGGMWEGSFGCEFLRGSMCAEGMGCGRRWVRWVLRGTETASGHPRIVTVIA